MYGHLLYQQKFEHVKPKDKKTFYGETPKKVTLPFFLQFLSHNKKKYLEFSEMKEYAKTKVFALAFYKCFSSFFPNHPIQDFLF